MGFELTRPLCWAALFAAALWAADPSAPPAGLAAPKWPPGNAFKPAKAELGRLLFFDVRLSADGSVSCASCHRPEHAFADPRPVSVGVGGRKGKRNAPTVLNRAFGSRQFWDGRADSLEAQAAGPLLNPLEMANTEAALVRRLTSIKGYGPLFQQAFGDAEITLARITQAIATFERTLLSGDAPFDRFQAGEQEALSASARRGKDLFFGRARCALCHSGRNFTNEDFANISAGRADDPDEGRFGITFVRSDWRLFKVPTLRDVALTAPYFHDGSAATLEEVIDFYDRGGVVAENKDYRIRPLRLTADEKRDLLEFLRSLTGASWRQARAPEEFPR